MRGGEQRSVAADRHDELRAVAVERRVRPPNPLHGGAELAERRIDFVDRRFVIVVRAAHLAYGGIVLLQQSGDALVLLLFDEEAVGGALDDDDDASAQGASSASRRSAISVLASSISPALTRSSASSIETVTRLACLSSTEPSSTGGTREAASISA